MRLKTVGWLLTGAALVLIIGYTGIRMISQTDSYERTAAKTNNEANIEKSAEPTPFGASGTNGPQLVAETQALALYIDPATTEISVKDKRNGHTWYSNPLDRESDKKAEGINRDNLSSQFSIAYNNDKGQNFYVNNFAEAIKRNQFEILKTSKGIKIVYQLGNFQKGMEAIPQIISKQRMDEMILSKIADEGEKFEIEKRFKFDEVKQIYTRKEMPEYVVKDVVAILDSVGYTAEEAAKDNMHNQAGGQKPTAAARFTVPIEYYLDDENFMVEVPVREIQDTKEFPIDSIQVLEMFGAAGVNHQGYMFVPDGSGALIHLNNGKISVPQYDMPIYGKDQSLREKDVVKEFKQAARLPVFGMKQSDQAFFCIIEEGDAIASVNADVSGRVNTYNRVSAKFLLKPMESFTYRAGSVKKDSPMFPELYQGGIKLRYAFLPKESASYVGMAKYYQDYLVKSKKLTKLEAEAETPFVLDLVGSIAVRDTFLGIPYQSVKSLTSFEQAKSVLAMLKQRGVKQIKLRYSGWFNRGVDHDFPDDVDIDSALGGKSGLQELIRYAKEEEIELYPDVSFLRVYTTGHGFKPKRDGASFLLREGIAQYKTDLVMGSRGELDYYLLSPKKLPDLVASFLKDYEPLQVGGLSLRDLGDMMISDVTSGRTTDREQSAAIIADSVKLLQEKVGNTMVSGGNANVLPYVKTIVDAPLKSSMLNFADEEIPFYQLVLHGYMDYAGSPINMSPDQSYKSNVLKTLETGSNVYYQWFYEKPSAVRNTEFNDLYSASYSNWLDEAVQYYRETNDVMRGLRTQTIVNHEKLADHVYRTTYESGTSITVNYNQTDVIVNGTSIAAEGYLVGGGGR
ncbi:DUF5696 domain-containing protein [Paenibacillus sp. EC2-1]|uniref:DUF5696 domain-containing protein n=1 Tax=Paenibacillus sp. EC2-1 TaxID=3388665 RepID=UPI003BEF122F